MKEKEPGKPLNFIILDSGKKDWLMEKVPFFQNFEECISPNGFRNCLKKERRGGAVSWKLQQRKDDQGDLGKRPLRLLVESEKKMDI